MALEEDAGLLIFVVGTVIAIIVIQKIRGFFRREKVVVATVNDGEKTPRGRSKSTPEMIQERVKDAQWRLIRKRLDFIDQQPSESSSLSSFSEVNSYACLGRISLCMDNRYNGPSDVPMPLFKENKEKLFQLGFEITEDQRWAIIKEL